MLKGIKHLHEGRVAALVCLLVLGMPATEVRGQTPPETVLQFIYWQNQGEKLPGSNALLADFAEVNPGVRINLAYERWSQAYSRLKYWTGSLRQYAPDLTVMRDVWLPEFSAGVVPLDDLLTARELTTIQPALLERCRVNGKLLGIPWLCEARVLYYRPDLFAAAKLPPPTTLEELRVAAKTLTGQGIYGLGLPASPGGGGTDAYLGLLWALGGTAVEEGKLNLKNDTAIAALQFWVELQTAGATQPEMLAWSSADLDTAFAAGKLAMVFSGPALGAYLKRECPDLKFATTPLPGAAVQPGQVAAQVLVIPRTSQHSAAAVRFLHYMLTPGAQRAMWLMGSLPAHTSLFEEARKDPAQAAFVQNLPQAQGMPLQHTDRVQRVVERALWLALSGRTTAAEALKTALQEDAGPGLAGG